jgi:hypothetical protein
MNEWMMMMMMIRGYFMALFEKDVLYSDKSEDYYN